jgi:hypothetical protein
MQLLDSFMHQLTSNCVITLSTMMLMIMTFIAGCHNFIVMLNVIRLSVVILSFVEFLEPYQKGFQNLFQDHFRLKRSKMLLINTCINQLTLDGVMTMSIMTLSIMKLDAGFHI